MADAFAGHPIGLNSPFSNAAAVTPHDLNALAATTRGIWVGGAGALAVTMAGGGNVTIAAVPAGSFLPLRVTHVLDTGTDASSIIALW